jgi:hypothetical protein
MPIGLIKASRHNKLTILLTADLMGYAQSACGRADKSEVPLFVSIDG